LQLTRPAKVTVSLTDADGNELYSGSASLKARQTFSLPADVKPELGQSVKVTDEAGRPLMSYTLRTYDTFNIPHTTEDMPNIGREESAARLYQEGVHVDQYRDPAVKGSAYYKEAIKRDPNYAPALTALGDEALRNASYDEALQYLGRAEQALTQFNKRPESGKLYFLIGQAYLGKGDTDRGYDYLQKAAWNRDYVSPAMTWIGIIDIARHDWSNAERHLATALRYQADNEQALALASYLPALQGDKAEAARRFSSLDATDKLNHLARFLAVSSGQLSDADFWAPIQSDKNQLSLDLLETLLAANLTAEAEALIASLEAQTPLNYSVAAIRADLNGSKPDPKATEGIAFPSRPTEMRALAKLADAGDAKAKSLLACALYAKGHYVEASARWSEVASKDYRASRNLAVADYTHLNRRDEVLPLMKQALALSPGNEQLVYETVYVMGKLGIDPKERIAFLEKNRRSVTRDDVNLEWARAYNMAGQEDKALALLKSRNFVPAEGGEHAVAEQYMMAYFLKGRKLMKEQRWADAAQCFAEAQTLPQNLGAGLWNSARLVPYKYYEALCLKQLGDDAKAQENFDFITGLEVDYFTNMHLPELPIYQALVYREEGNPLKGDMMVNYKVQDWQAGLKAADAGWFGTTPFFLSFVDAPEQARTAYFSYLLALANRYMGNDAAADDYIRQAAAADPYALNIFAER
jgi:Tfp pilus assembly protein PilF